MKKQNFEFHGTNETMKPFSISYAKLNFAIWGQHCEIKSHGNFFHEKFCARKFLPLRYNDTNNALEFQRERK